VISKVLYPEDSHLEGKKLRLKQQYFFVSATVQSIVKEHLETYGTLENFHEKNVLQINDTHPTLAIPELMRVLIDDAGFDWDTAWNITKNSIAYTNHTVLAEALERWPQSLMQQMLPRVWQIITEIAARWEKECRDYWHDEEKVHKLAVIWDGEVRMANLCLAGTMSVNGVSGLHTEILRREVFAEGNAMHPEQFHNVTNGVDHRRWLAEINPGLNGLVCDLIGDGYLTRPEQLTGLDRFADDASVLNRLGEIKQRNKVEFTEYLRRTQGVSLDADSIFDVQVKRLHEYKRQMLNALHILYLYQKLQDDPNALMRPQTFLFGAKSAPGYVIAKRTISLINSIADQINQDPLCRGRLQVVFLENYRVSLAERLMPASEVSEQISTAGKEASGTGNMKFMMNGALTVGTLDGANVEMHEVLGDENMFLFGLHADEVAALRGQGYDPKALLAADPALAAAMEKLRTGFKDGKAYEDLYEHLLSGGNGCRADEYMTLADFGAYCRAQEAMRRTYEDRTAWNAMSLHNIARSGIFAADRAVGEYADHIWHVPYKK
jgi:starch phosphorylase